MEQMKYMVGQSNRDALIVLPGAVIGETPDVQQVLSGSYSTITPKVPFEKAVHSIVDKDLWDDKETKIHIEFEKEVISFFHNHDFEDQSKTTDSFKFSHHHWTRQHWVVHNFENPLAKTLRCDWYHEQMNWNDVNDNISFAHILARLEFERFHSLMDDVERNKILDEQARKDIDLQSDEYQWSIVKYPHLSHHGYVRIIDDRALIIERKLWHIQQETK
jgi:hypothetical protein